MICLGRIYIYIYIFFGMVNSIVTIIEERDLNSDSPYNGKQTILLSYTSFLTIKLILIKLKGTKFMAKIYFAPSKFNVVFILVT